MYTCMVQLIKTLIVYNFYHLFLYIFMDKTLIPLPNLHSYIDCQIMMLHVYIYMHLNNQIKIIKEKVL